MLRRKWPWFLAGLYFAWSVLVYFGSLSGEHQWWPLFLDPLIYPWGYLFHRGGVAIFDWLVPQPTASDFVLFDRIEGGLFIVGGTIWIWCLVTLFSFIVRRVFPHESPQV
jgi:hypothetical protein